EKSVGSQQTITASYVAAAGRRLLRREVLSGSTLANPKFTTVIVTTNGADSDYHALQLQFQRRLSRGLQALASYTWSHSIDDASSKFNRYVPKALVDQKTTRASSNFDVRHSFTAAVTYDISAPTTARFVSAFLSNWSADAIFRGRTATPVDVVTFAPFFGV